jgi:predicted enzyme related to lactoylglutathione lyase
MTNPHGTPIWYELQATDLEAAKTFYEAVIGWTVGPKPEGPMDYRMIGTGDGEVGGLAGLAPGMTPDCMKPGWKLYFGVDDVDASAAEIAAAGGTVHLEPFDLEGVGRMAFVADPQGNVFYIMRGLSDEGSTAWSRDGLGKCNWNELVTTDQAAAHDFYARIFGWKYPDRMPMPGMGDYVFVEAAGETIGATMQKGTEEQPTGWQFYFRAPDIEAAAETFRAKGGTVFVGPMEVPGGDRIIFGTDPAGTAVGVVGPGDTQ